jgi:hypothetical protein
MGVRNQYSWFGSLFLDPRKKLLASSAIVERGGFAAIAQIGSLLRSGAKQTLGQSDRNIGKGDRPISGVSSAER